MSKLWCPTPVVPRDVAGPGDSVHPPGAGQLPHRARHHLLLRRQETEEAQTEGSSGGGHQVCAEQKPFQFQFNV